MKLMWIFMVTYLANMNEIWGMGNGKKIIAYLANMNEIWGVGNGKKKSSNTVC
jgi:hypothetical protein